jgi:hypothetical protein
VQYGHKGVHILQVQYEYLGECKMQYGHQGVYCRCSINIGVYVRRSMDTRVCVQVQCEYWGV